MVSPREGSPQRPRRRARWAAVAACGLLSAVGCQAEYAGMTLPSGKYMLDDVQYFPPGPEFPWANSQAAQQRAKMMQMGLNVSPGGPVEGPALNPPPAPGAVPGAAGVAPGVNVGPGGAPVPPGEINPGVPAPDAANPIIPPEGGGMAPGNP